MVSSMDPAPGSTPMAMLPDRCDSSSFRSSGMAKAFGHGYTLRTRRLPPSQQQSRGNPGIYLIANDQPLAVRDCRLPAFARWLNAPPPPQISVRMLLKRDGGADAVYYATQMRGVSNAKAKRELNFQPRPLEWIIELKVSDCGSSRAK